MRINLITKKAASSALVLGAIVLSGCASHGTRYAGNSACANGQVVATQTYSECGFYWAERWVAIPTYNTIQTVVVREEVEKEVIKEVVVEKEVIKEVYVEVPTPQPPIMTYPPIPDYTPPPLPLRK